MVFARDASFFNDQFGEDDDERSERQAARRKAAWCSACGAGNPVLGYACLPECTGYQACGAGDRTR